jgi:elongation factor 2
MGQPVVSFCETVKNKTELVVISKSPNKHNRIYLQAQPTGEDFCKAIDSKEITAEQEMKVRARLLADNYKWDVTEARKIWSLGLPPDGMANVLVDMTKGVAYLNEIKDSACTAFQQVTNVLRCLLRCCWLGVVQTDQVLVLSCCAVVCWCCAGHRGGCAVR